MSEIKPEKETAAALIEEEQDWEAAKAFFESLKTKVPRPVSSSLNSSSLFFNIITFERI